MSSEGGERSSRLPGPPAPEVLARPSCAALRRWVRGVRCARAWRTLPGARARGFLSCVPLSQTLLCRCSRGWAGNAFTTLACPPHGPTLKHLALNSLFHLLCFFFRNIHELRTTKQENKPGCSLKLVNPFTCLSLPLAPSEFLHLTYAMLLFTFEPSFPYLSPSALVETVVLQPSARRLSVSLPYLPCTEVFDSFDHLTVFGGRPRGKHCG